MGERERTHKRDGERKHAIYVWLHIYTYIELYIYIYIYTYMYIYACIDQERGIYIFVVSFKFHAVDMAL